MVLAVWTLESWAAPPVHRDQHFLLDLVHWLLGHSIPEKEGSRGSAPLVSPLGLKNGLSTPLTRLWLSGSQDLPVDMAAVSGPGISLFCKQL